MDGRPQIFLNFEERKEKRSQIMSIYKMESRIDVILIRGRRTRPIHTAWTDVENQIILSVVR